MKKINFQTVAPIFDLPKPTPSSKMIPSWFRKMSGVIDKNETIKKCMPFLDAMTSGYTILLAADILVTDDGIQQISKDIVVASHSKSQIEGMPIPINEYDNQPYKWINFFLTKTPKGYSTLFVHPLNRLDLPFYSLSGVVETDNHPVPVNFPFFIKKNFRGLIPAGTPIAQAIPFKRVNWQSEVNDTSAADASIWIHKILNPPFNFYKRNFWVRKTYK